MSRIFENQYVYVEVENSEIPWLKIFSKSKEKEFSACDAGTQAEIFRLLLLIEKEMLVYFKPDKINIASFGNMLPEVHWHIMARFKNDSYFPEPMWGEQQRVGNAAFPSMSDFITQLAL